MFLRDSWSTLWKKEARTGYLVTLRKYKFFKSPEIATIQAEYNETQLWLGKMCLSSEEDLKFLGNIQLPTSNSVSFPVITLLISESSLLNSFLSVFYSTDLLCHRWNSFPCIAIHSCGDINLKIFSIFPTSIFFFSLLSICLCLSLLYITGFSQMTFCYSLILNREF